MCMEKAVEARTSFLNKDAGYSRKDDSIPRQGDTLNSDSSSNLSFIDQTLVSQRNSMQNLNI